MNNENINNQNVEESVKSENFSYSYTAIPPEAKREVANIRNQYSATQEAFSDIDELRRLDKKVKQPPVIISLCLGIIGLLVFGIGMTFALEWNNIIVGVILGIVGIIPIALAYPAYNFFLRKGKAKYCERILEISDKILNNN